MKLTTKSEYALLALIYLARHDGNGTYVKIEDICGEYDISKKYLEQIFISLKQARYIKAKRGSSGGYSLAKAPQRITVAEVIRLMDGALAPDLSVSKYFYSKTPVEKEKKVMNFLSDIREYITRKVEKLRISDLV